MVVVVSRSERGNERRPPRLWLGCERGGKYRLPKKKASIEVSENKDEEGGGRGEELGDMEKSSEPRRTGTKKCDCPFSLKGTYYKETNQWALEVVCGSNNHELTRYLEGHSYAGRLTPDELKLVHDLSKCNSRPRDILHTLQLSHTQNKSTIKTIYNIRHKNKQVEHCDRSHMQYLIGKLQQHNYFFHTRRCEHTDIVKDVFWAHPTSVKLLRSFPSVLLMDCTYKMNRHKFLLLEIVGVTSTNMTFSAACAYLECGNEDNYIWACTILKDLMDQDVLPTVFITGRELALMNAIERTFPSSRHLLCRWYINNGVTAKCKKYFYRKEKWESFYISWNLLMLADSEPRFEELLKRFMDDFSNQKEPVNYVLDNWIKQYKERFVSCWVNNVMHFGNSSTNRAESHHAKLKIQLRSSMNNFETCWEKTHTLLEISHDAVKSSFERSINVVQHRYGSPMFELLRGIVSIAALDKMLGEMVGIGESGVNPLSCGCVLRKTCGLPCAHELDEYIRGKLPIPLDKVDKFWRKLDMEPVVSAKINVGCDDSQWNEVMGEINNIFERANESEKWVMLKRLREVAHPTTTSLIEPQVQQCTRGRPKKSNKKNANSTKRNSNSLESIESSNDNCSPVEDTFGVSGPNV